MLDVGPSFVQQDLRLSVLSEDLLSSLDGLVDLELAFVRRRAAGQRSFLGRRFQLIVRLFVSSVWRVDNVCVWVHSRLRTLNPSGSHLPAPRSVRLLLSVGVAMAGNVVFIFHSARSFGLVSLARVSSSIFTDNKSFARHF